jgi:predicted dehydrogenase
VGVGVIGLGVGEQHARAFAQHPDCRLVAVCDRDPAKMADVATRLPDCRQYAAAEDLIANPDIQVVGIASNDNDHYQQIVRSFRAGKHVFTELPLCLAESELRDIQSLWRASGGLRLSTNTMLRLSPRFVWLRQAIGEGRLGTVYCVEADYVYGRLHKLTEGWRGRIPNYSVMLGGGIHLLDLVLWMTGQRPVEVMAYGSGLASRNTSFQGNDLVLALLRFDNGMVVKIGANFASVHPHFHRLVVYGTEATFENPPEAPQGPARLWTSRDPAQAPAPIDAAYPGVAKSVFIPSFVDAVLGRGEPYVAEDEVFAAISVALAIDRAVAEGRPVSVAYN